MAGIEITMTELVWPGKYNEDGIRKEVPRANLLFRVIETIDEGRIAVRNSLTWRRPFAWRSGACQDAEVALRQQHSGADAGLPHAMSSDLRKSGNPPGYPHPGHGGSPAPKPGVFNADQ